MSLPPPSPPPMEAEAEAEAEENSPVEQVAMTVPTTDDPSLPAMTFRMWVLGTVSCVLLSFANQFFWYRSEPLSISAVTAQIAVIPLGHFMAKVLPDRVFLQGTWLEFSLNPGPFNVKEHVLITIFANSGAGGVYAMHIVTAVKTYYRRKLTFFVAFLVVLTTQVLGFGWAGIFRRFLVEPASMWWPSTLVQVSLFRALHEKEKRPKGSLSRMQFFVVALLCSFAYYVLPGYLFSMLTSLSWVCWVLPKSILAQQLGSGMSGIGLGAVGFDWSTITSYLGSPLASPLAATVNVGVGYALLMYIVVPVAYWTNAGGAKKFPFFSQDLFTRFGQQYKISQIIDSRFRLDTKAYADQGPVFLSAFFVMTYAVGFAALPATIVHCICFHGREMWALTGSALKSRNRKLLDIHTRLMKKYEEVPQWWFLAVLVSTFAVSLAACLFYNDQLQLPWWGIAASCVIAFLFTLPIGIITATTNQAPGLNVITEYIIGLAYPGRPVANIMFKVYGYISMTQALTFLSDFKLGHYMKIPPKSMFLVQVIGTVIAAFCYLSTGWYLLETVPHICIISDLPKDSPWTCPMDHTFYSASVIWGLIGPKRIFLDTYPLTNWAFLAGAIAPVLVYLASRAIPTQSWIRDIQTPVILSAAAMMPPASAVNYTTWLAAAFMSGYVMFRYRRAWFERHNYVLSAGLDAGTAFMGIVLYFVLQSRGVALDWWGNNVDGCPLATCPTARGIVVDGCPVF